MDEALTTITLTKATKQRLEVRKIHPNQSYDEVIQKLLTQVRA